MGEFNPNIKYFYGLSPLRSEKDSYLLPEFVLRALNDLDLYSLNIEGLDADNEKNNKFSLDYVYDWCFDSRRVLNIVVLRFENIPLALIMCAGREGRDQERLFVTNKEGWRNFESYLRSFYIEDDSHIPLYEEEYCGKDLIEIYGKTLGEEDFTTKRKGDGY